METKKIVTLMVVPAIGGIVVWQGMEMFGGGADAVEVAKVKTVPNPDTPKPASLLKTKAEEKAKTPMTEREVQLMQVQQQMQEKYMATLNSLQQLTADLAIAEANKLIMKAKADTVEAQKKILTILTPPQPKILNDALGGSGASSGQSGSTTTTTITTSNPVTVLSVTNIHGKWNAVIGVDNKLYTVAVGDILVTDGSVITAISKAGVTMVKDNKEKQVTMSAVI